MAHPDTDKSEGRGGVPGPGRAESTLLAEGGRASISDMLNHQGGQGCMALITQQRKNLTTTHTSSNKLHPDINTHFTQSPREPQHSRRSSLIG